MIVFLIGALSINAQTPEQLHVLADSLFQEKAYELADEVYRELLEIYSESGSWPSFLETANQQLLCKHRLRRNTEALELMGMVLPLVEGREETEPQDLALAYHKHGVTYSRFNNYDQSAKFYLKALQLRESFLPANHPDIIRGYHNVGRSYYRLLRYDEAIDFLNQSIRLHPDSVINKSLISDSYRALSRLYRDLGEFEIAKNYLDISVGYVLDNERRKNSLYGDLSSLYIKFKKPRLAIEHAKGRLAILKNEKPEDLELDLWESNLAVNHHNLGAGYWLSELSESMDSAIHHYQIAAMLNDKIFGEQHPKLALNYEGLGLAYQAKGDYSNALRYLERAENIYGLNLDLLAQTRIQENLGDLHAEVKDYRNAMIKYQEGVTSLLPWFKPISIYDNPLMQEEQNLDELTTDQQIILLDLIISKGACFAVLFENSNAIRDIQASYENFELADQLIDLIRLSFRADVSKSILAEETKAYYENAIDVCLQYFQVSKNRTHYEKAFYYSEKSKAIILYEAIRENQAMLSDDLPEQLIEREQELKRSIAYLKNLIFQSSESEESEILKLREELVSKETEFYNLLDTFESKFQNYFDIKYNADFASVEEVQAYLNESNSSLFSYFAGEENLYSFHVTPDLYEVYTNELTIDLTSVINGFREGLTNCEIPNWNCSQTAELYVPNARILSELLLGNFEKSQPVEQVFIVPDERLGYIPFDVLVQGKGSNPPLIANQDVNFHISDCQMSYATSANLLLKQSSDSNKPLKNIISFAPDYINFSFKKFNDSDNNLGAADRLEENLRSGFFPLQGAQEEVVMVSKLFGSKKFQNKSASEQNFKNHAPDYKVLHLAMHSLIENDEPLFSKLLFTQNSSGTKEDDQLTISEIYNLDLNAQLAILSSCETGFGKVRSGEGIISLGRAFQYAGVPSLVVSLWKVPDEATSVIIVEFLKNLKSGMNKSAALRQAKITYLESPGVKEYPDLSHPFYWSGFIVAGDISSLEFSSTEHLSSDYLIALAMLLSLFALIFIISRISKSEFSFLPGNVHTGA